MYLSIEDLKKGIHSEDLTVIVREEQNAIQAIAEAQAEVESYLSARYDIASELAKTPSDTNSTEGDGRNIMVVKLVRDITLFNCYNITSPVNMPKNRIQSYENAVKFLRDVQSEKANITGLKRLNTSEDGTVSSNYISFTGSSTKRTHHL